MRRRTRILLWSLGALLALGTLAAWKFHGWGQPVPVAYRRVAVTPANPGGGRSFTYLRRDARGRPVDRWVAVDTDDDGTVDQVLAEGDSLSSFARPAAGDPDTRRLILCLDGVPFQEMLALWEQGYFRELFRPVPLISPFPSDSESALTDLFHAAPVPGYEHRYFDRVTNRLAGGAFTTLTGKNIPYLKLLDYDMPGTFKGVTYLVPHKSYRADLGRFRKRFLASQEKVFFAHIASSDSLYHILPREEMRELLTEVDSLLRELYFDAGGRLRITLFSDHGNSLTESRPVPLKKSLEAHGWRLRDRLEAPRDLAVPAYGLVGFLAVYCQPAARAELAADLAQLEGADLAVYRDGDSVLLEGRSGRARLLWKPDGSDLKYEAIGGESLELDGERYPDVDYRLWQWATNHVANRADIMVSLKPGYYYGSGTFQRLVTIRSTHGALDAAQSLGFAMSTDAPLPGPIRSKDLLPVDPEAKTEKRN